MTQALMKHGYEGAEILARVINAIFDEVVNAVYERGGFVSTFAGDAFTAIFPFHDDLMPPDEVLLHVLACVKKLQSIFRQYRIQTTPLGQFLLQFKVGLSGGNVNWGIVGQTDKAYFFRGEAIDGCVASEYQAEKGEVIFDSNLAQQLRKVSGSSQSARYLRSLQVDRLKGGYYRIKEFPESLLEEFGMPVLPDTPELHPDILARFVPELLIHLSEQGEFRYVVSIFISFDGISTINALNDWAFLLLNTINIFGGYFQCINFGDKGGSVLCGFGAPVMYENEVERALDWILSIKEGVRGCEHLSGLTFRAGISYGRVYAGIAGGEKRCVYTYYGEVVNLAARFMMKANWGEILVSDAVRDKTVHFDFAHKGDLMYKGFADPVSTWILTSRKSGISQRFTEAMIGRHEELQELQQFAAPIFEHTFAGIVCIYGEAGIGKSRLAYALQETLRQQHPLQWFTCPADQIIPKPFHPFITCFMRYFAQASEHTEAENKAAFEEKYEALVEALNTQPEDPHPRPLSQSRAVKFSEYACHCEESSTKQSPDTGEIASQSLAMTLSFRENLTALLSQRARGEDSPHSSPPPTGEGEDSPRPLGEGLGVRGDVQSEFLRTKTIIGALMGLSWPDSLWDQLDAKGKYDNTISAVKTFFLAQSLLCPVVIALEDGQWLDSDSLVVLQALTRHVSQYPFLIFSTIRYSEYGSKPCLLNPQNLTARNIPYKEIELREFSEADLRNFAEAHLGSPISEEFYAVLAEKTNGNPFFAEQLLHYFIENELVERTAGRWQLKTGDPNLPADTINVAVMYSESLKEPYYKKSTQMPDAINAMLMARIDRLSDEVKEVVKTASVIGREFDVRLLSAMLKRDVHVEVNLAEKSRIWHVVQELLYIFKHALLRDIAYEMQLKARLHELHQLAAETMEKLYEPHLARWYADLAFHYEQAENRDKAVEYLEKAGDEAKAQYQNQQALALYDRLLAHLQEMFGFTEVEIDTLLKKAEILDLIGEWKTCQQVCEDALQLAEQIDDKRRMGQAHRTLGIIFRRTGQYDRAMASFEQAMALFKAVNERAGIEKVLRSMGVTYWLKSDYDAAMARYEKALKISEEEGDTLGMAIITNNIGVLHDLQGHYDAAMTWYQKSVQNSEELGEKLNKSKVLNNMGENRRLQGKYKLARKYYEKALTLAEELGDKLQITIALGNIGHVYKAQGDGDKALVPYNRAITILRELDNKYCLGEYLIGRAETLFSLQRYQEARALNAEGLQFAEEVGRKEYILQGKVLSAKIAFALGEEEVPRRLEEMLQQTKDDTESAALHYELWKMTGNEDHRQMALSLGVKPETSTNMVRASNSPAYLPCW